MSGISSALIKTLREKTGAGMSDCKTALVETHSDIEAAVDWLRKKGMAAAAKKSFRITADGLVSAYQDGNRATVVEINSETDFVAMSPHFQSFAKDIAKIAFDQGGDLNALLTSPFKDQGHDVKEALTHLIATVGENIQIRRVAHLSVEQGAVSTYTHSSIAPDLGKIGVIVALESSTANVEALKEAGKKIAMHIAAANPIALTKEEIDPSLVERERAILKEKAETSGKSEEIVAKMVESGIKKFFDDSVLIDQPFVIDNKIKISDYIANLAKELGAPITLKGYVRFGLGDGIEKAASDFVAQVKAQAGQN